MRSPFQNRDGEILRGRQAVRNMGLAGHLQTKFVGKESRRMLPAPIRLAKGTIARQMIWRKGEKQGPADGLQVGLVYQLKGGVTAAGYGDHLLLRARGGDVVIEPGDEENFLRELLAVLEV